MKLYYAAEIVLVLMIVADMTSSCGMKKIATA